ncbi:hypothetical protein ACFONG_15725 [Uliginosibacterium paludis]|uniref:Uncharacterized protein n=1 Tax=Uliginosibacterium paludis TaxID=1615952 RepID=A0ABV2CV35_9RHOO
MNGLVYAKTTAGMQEVQLRHARLHPRARSLLILIDGKQCVNDLCGKFATPALVQEYLDVLQEKGLIQALSSYGKDIADEVLSQEPQHAEAPLSEQQSLPPAGRAERLAALKAIMLGAIEEYFSAQPDAYLESLGRARRMRDFVALGNEIITVLNKTGRIAAAVEFKQKVKPLLR